MTASITQAKENVKSLSELTGRLLSNTEMVTDGPQENGIETPGNYSCVHVSITSRSS